MNKASNIWKRYLCLALCIGLLWLGIGNLLWANEAAVLKDIEIDPLNQNGVQVKLIFTGPVITSNGFSIDSPASIVYDFPSVRNGLPKNKAAQTSNIGILNGLNVVEGGEKTRLVMHVKSLVPFKAKSEGNVVYIILEADLLANMGDEPSRQCEGRYRIDNIDFRRSDQGAGRVIVDLSDPNGIVNFKEEDGKLIADFIGADISPGWIKQYDVTDFGTPIRNYTVSQRGNRTTVTVETIGRFDKIAYQMDNQFIIEARSLSQGAALTNTGAVNYTGERISLNFQDIDLRAVLQVVADFAGFNLIASDEIKGNVTLRLQNVPWDQALDIILKSKNLDKRQTGTVLMVGPAEELANQELKDLNAKKQISEMGPLRSELITLNYAKVEAMQKLLKEKGNSVMTSRGSVNVDTRTNTLIVQDIDSKIAEVKALVQKLDVPVRQVEISTQIITTDNIFEKTFGVKFGGAGNITIGQRRLGVGSTMDRARATADFGTRVPPSNVDFTGASPINSNIVRQPLVASAPGPQVNNTEGLFSDLGAALITPGQTGALGKVGLALARLPNGTLLDLELQALELESKTKTIARPKLLTMDGATAFVEKGVQIPYQESSSSGATSVSFKPAVLRLDVTPHITPDDKVFMDLKITNDTQGANLPVQTSANGVPVITSIPIINSNKLETQVLVDNGETIVLGGIFQIADQKRFQKIPFLGDLPFIGGMFRNYDIYQNPQELIIFITPKIVKPLYDCE